MATNPHIYVDSNHGTNTGATDTSKATQQTGNITSMTAGDVYTNLSAAIAGCSPSDGDTIYMCDNHDAGASYANITLNSGGSATGAGLKIISVDNTNIDQYKAGAYENNTLNGADHNFAYNGFIAGVKWRTNDNTMVFTSTARHWSLYECEIVYVSVSDWAILLTSPTGCLLRLIDCTIDHSSGTVNQCISIANGNQIDWIGGATTASGGNDIVNLINFGNYGGIVNITGVDLFGVETSLCTSTAGTTANFNLNLQNCKLDAALTSVTGTMGDAMHRIEMHNCDQSSTDNLHRFYIETGSGKAVNNNSVYVTANPAFFEGTDKSSIQVTTTSSCSIARPFTFEMPTRYIDFGDTSSDKVSINIVTDFTLNEEDIAFYLMYPDGTTQVQANFIGGESTSSTSFIHDPLASGTALNTTGALTAADWTGEPASPNFYLIELDTVGDAGEAFAPRVWCEVYKASITTGLLYIDPVLAVGT
jgi:hypothetical protein